MDHSTQEAEPCTILMLEQCGTLEEHVKLLQVHRRQLVQLWLLHCCSYCFFSLLVDFHDFFAINVHQCLALLFAFIFNFATLSYNGSLKLGAFPIECWPLDPAETKGCKRAPEVTSKLIKKIVMLRPLRASCPLFLSYMFRTFHRPKNVKDFLVWATLTSTLS